MSLSILLTLSSLLILLGIRNDLIFRIRRKAIAFVYSQPNWIQLRRHLYKPTYNNMMFDLTRWTYKQFYADLSS